MYLPPTIYWCVVEKLYLLHLEWKLSYVGFNYVDDILTSKLNKHPIRLSLEDFTTVCNLSCTWSNYDINEESSDFKFLATSTLFMYDPNIIIPTPFIVILVRPSILLVHYMIHTFFSTIIISYKLYLDQNLKNLFPKMLCILSLQASG